MMPCTRFVITLGVSLALLTGSDALLASSGDPEDAAGRQSSPTAGPQTESESTQQNPSPASTTEGATGERDSAQQPDLPELQRRLDALAAEVERLRSGEVGEIELSADDIRALGLAPSAAATYGRTQGVSIAGYGEMLFETFAREDEAGRPTRKGSQFDFLRMVVYGGYRFNDKFLFNSEIEVEHANEIFVEFAYVDYLAHENVGVRGGMLLVPMGLVNEFHEPTVFFGAERPVTEQRIIPSTWRENGVGLYGSIDRVTFRAYVMNGFKGSQFSSDGIRGGRQKGSEAKASNFAFVGRVDPTPTPGVFVGASLYSGGSGQGEITVDGRDFDVRTTIVDLHTQVQMRGLDLRGLYARANIGDAAALNQALGLSGTSGVAETMEGGYLQVGYNVLSQLGRRQSHALHSRRESRHPGDDAAWVRA